VYLEDFEKRNIPISVFRYWYLTSHYATSANFTWDTIMASEKAFNKIVKLVQENPVSEIENFNKKYYDRALKELNHDVGTAEAIAIIWEIIKDNSVDNKTKVATILKIDKILGIGFKKESLKDESAGKIPAGIIEIANKRKAARKNKDFAESDKLRDVISQAGYNIIDKGDDFEIVSK
jgi:cysteinyl-tRNA synthetase